MIGPVIPPEVAIASRLFGAGLFAFAAYGKLRNWTPFIGIVGNYRLVPGGTERLAAVAIVTAEVAVAGLLATGFGAPFGGQLGIALLLAFAAAMTIAIARGQRTIDCGCFQTSLRQTLSGLLVLRNLVLAALLLPALATAGRLNGPMQLVDGIGAALALLLLNGAVATMLANREANARLSARFA